MALVIPGHHDELSVRNSVAHGVREARGRDPSLDNVALVVADRGCSGVRPARSPYDRLAERRNETITEAWLLLVVPVTRAEDIEFSERVELERETHSVTAASDAR